MKYGKIKAFFGFKKVADTVAEKVDGTVMFNAEQAAAIETMAGDLETANANLQTANENASALQGTIDTHVSNGKAVRTELSLPETATNEEVVTAIQGLKTEIVTLGKQPGSLGTTVQKEAADKVETEVVENKAFRTSFDDEADAELAQMGITSKSK